MKFVFKVDLFVFVFSYTMKSRLSEEFIFLTGNFIIYVHCKFIKKIFAMHMNVHSKHLILYNDGNKNKNIC